MPYVIPFAASFHGCVADLSHMIDNGEEDNHDVPQWVSLKWRWEEPNSLVYGGIFFANNCES